PGGASPPPGMPVFRGPEPLASYLLTHGIRFVAYSYGNEALFPKSEKEQLLQSPWVQGAARAAFAFQDSLLELMRSRRLRFDDGERAMIDLAEHRTGATGEVN